MRNLISVVGLLAVLACNDSTGPENDLTGHWELIGYSDAGVAGITTGSAIFRANGTFTIDGTVTYPGEPTEPIQAAGTWSIEGDIVTLDTGSESGRWIRSLVGGDILLTLEGSQPPTTITLRRAGLEGAITLYPVR
jgi:hypothetical protein